MICIDIKHLKNYPEEERMKKAKNMISAFGGEKKLQEFEALIKKGLDVESAVFKTFS